MLTERNIVIAEDNAVLRSLLTAIFRECGWRIRSAENGFAALDAIREETPAILLSDLEMDGMSGFEMLSIVRRRFPYIKVVAMSGAFSGTEVPSGVAADFFYAKGGSVSTLLDLVAELSCRALVDLSRKEVPIWRPAHYAAPSPDGCLSIACSNCLRSVHLDKAAVASDEELTCSHCRGTMRVHFSHRSFDLDSAMGGPRRTLPYRPVLSVHHAARGACL